MCPRALHSAIIRKSVEGFNWFVIVTEHLAQNMTRRSLTTNVATELSHQLHNMQK